MTLNTTDRKPDFQSVGVDAVDLARYSHVATNSNELIVFDEGIQDAWIQSSRWIPVDSME